MEVMCKIAGTMCVVGSAWLYAKERAYVMELCLSQLMQLYSILIQLKSELQYMNTTLPECFVNLAGHVNPPFDKWLYGMADEMNNERKKSFGDIWVEYIGFLRQDSQLGDSAIDILTELKDKLGEADVAASLKAIDYVLIRIEEERESLKNEIQQRKKVILSLSLFAGFVVVILLF
mgnify:CR=1 FL=1